MTPVNTLALIFALAILIKVIILATAPIKWFVFANIMAKNSRTWQVVYLIAALLIGYFLLTELTFIQIVAALLFSTLLIGVAFWSYPKAIPVLIKEASTKKPWLPIVIYLAIALYTLFILFL